MKHLFLIILIIPFTLLSQQKETFRIEFNTDFRGFEMEEFNDRINDPAFQDTSLYDNFSQISLSEGVNFGMSVLYQPFQFISLGVYGGYQFGKTTGDIRLILSQYGTPAFNDTFPGKRTFKTQSVQIGLRTNIILNQMDFWKKKLPSSRLESSINFRTGYGFATLFTDYSFEGLAQDDIGFFYYSSGFQFVSTYKLGYLLSNKKYFSSIGISVGYQYFQTGNLLSEGGEHYVNNRKTKLDFSGFNVGLYLSIGR